MKPEGDATPHTAVTEADGLRLAAHSVCSRNIRTDGRTGGGGVRRGLKRVHPESGESAPWDNDGPGSGYKTAKERLQRTSTRRQLLTSAPTT
jgi:hypothetical protein